MGDYGLFWALGGIAVVAGVALVMLAVLAPNALAADASLEQQRAEHESATIFYFGLVMAILLPIVGFLIGLVLLGQDASRGIRVIVGSIGAAVLWYVLVLR